MVEVPDLSKLNQNGHQPDYNNLSEEERRRLAQMASETPVAAVAAFVVYQEPNGVWSVTTDLDQVFEIQRETTPDDVTAGCSVALRDIQTQIAVSETAKLTTTAVIQNMMAISQQVAENRTVAEVGKILEKGKKRR